MSRDGFIMPLGLALLFVLAAPVMAPAAGGMEELLPPHTCGSGWRITGKPLFYDRETLSDRINGESELYLPYGFDRMAAARYDAEKNPGTGMDVEIYRMGSPLDAFGMFANYRQKGGHTLPFGAGSNLSASQLYLYQGRYFVHIQTTGGAAADQGALASCGSTVTSRLPGSPDRPPELALFDRPELVKDSERYLPQSLLGYDFLNRGLVADAILDSADLQVFILLGATVESASTAFGSYRSQLTRAKIDAAGNNSAFLEGIDPLYGPVIILKKGGCLAGALKFNGKKGIRSLLEGLCR